MNLLQLEQEVQKMRDEGHGDDTLVVVAVPYKNGIGAEQREPINLHFASGAIWIPVKE